MDNYPRIDFSPRIYCVDPLLVAISGWDDLLERCAGMGFDHVLLCGDQTMPDMGKLDSNGSAAEQSAQHGIGTLAQFEELVELCKEYRLRLLVDIALTRFSADDAIQHNHPDWFAVQYGAEFSSDPSHIRNEDPLPDPRHLRTLHISESSLITCRPRFEDVATSTALLDWWNSRLAGLISAGVDGFCCHEPASVPVHFWRRLIAATREQHTSCNFLAWTPGCAHDQLDALTGSGFDAVFSSGAWWDFRDPWYFREYEKLSAIAPVLAFPEDPYGPRLARVHGFDDLQTRRLGALRALHFATVSAQGWLMPMGFEYGLPDSLSVARSAGRAGRLTTPESFWQACANADFDLSSEVTQANRTMATRRNDDTYRPRKRAPKKRRVLSPSASLRTSLKPLSAPDASWLLMERQDAGAHESLLIGINPRLDKEVRITDDGWHQRLHSGVVQRQGEELVLAPGAVQVLPLAVLDPVTGERDHVTSEPEKLRASRIAIERVSPAVDHGRFAAKRIVGEHFLVGADIFMDGHDHLAAEVLVRAADEKQWSRVPMHLDVNDRWQAQLSLTRLGRHYFCIEAWSDEFETFRDGLKKKVTAGQNVALEMEEGRLFITKLVEQGLEQGIDRGMLERGVSLLEALAPLQSEEVRISDGQIAKRLALLCAEDTELLVRDLIALTGARAFVTRSAVEYPVEAERTAAIFSNWYELFPRSQSGSTDVHGTFADVIKRLPAIRAMGFDTLYFPPIHPIGEKNRKGKNNSVTAEPGDPGSPYAIGSAEGGHDAIHPQLGTLDDFLRLRDAAAEHGLELALDFAIQCAPDHPWLREHPGWFAWRPDGSMRYAENPPKKYQDIVNVDFYAEDAIPDLWIALRDVVTFWVQQGVYVFRVDNPHTKPFPFWEWMIESVRSRYPQVIFLSEAFTRPKPMYRLAKAGFSQSYTYFTWRHGKQEFIDYLTELTTENGDSGQPRNFYRPHFFVNTPDINPTFLQRSGRAGFQIRAALAATLSGLWGVYSGFELCEAQAVPGKEEYLDSEKYEIRAWDWKRPGNIIDDITRLNQIRAENPALQTHLGVRFLSVSNDQILYFVKSTVPMPSGARIEGGAERFGDNTVLVAINLDPFHSQQGEIELPIAGFGLSESAENAHLQVVDVLTEHRFEWYGERQSIVLDPRERPYCIWRIRAGGI